MSIKVQRHEDTAQGSTVLYHTRELHLEVRFPEELFCKPFCALPSNLEQSLCPAHVPHWKFLSSHRKLTEFPLKLVIVPPIWPLHHTKIPVWGFKAHVKQPNPVPPHLFRLTKWAMAFGLMIRVFYFQHHHQAGHLAIEVAVLMTTSWRLPSLQDQGSVPAAPRLTHTLTPTSFELCSKCVLHLLHRWPRLP